METVLVPWAGQDNLAEQMGLDKLSQQVNWVIIIIIISLTFIFFQD